MLGSALFRVMVSLLLESRALPHQSGMAQFLRQWGDGSRALIPQTCQWSLCVEFGAGSPNFSLWSSQQQMIPFIVAAYGVLLSIGKLLFRESCLPTEWLWCLAFRHGGKDAYLRIPLHASLAQYQDAQIPSSLSFSLFVTNLLSDPVWGKTSQPSIRPVWRYRCLSLSARKRPGSSVFARCFCAEWLRGCLGVEVDRAASS